MTDLRSLRGRTWQLLSESTPALRARAASMRSIPGERDVIARAPIFSPFVVEHARSAVRLSEELMNAADAIPGEGGLAAALDVVEQRRMLLGPDLAHFALMIFAVHHPKGRLLAAAIPPLAVREPEKALRVTVPGERAVLPAPDGLEWYREDPFANEHHEHWHIVYPTGGIPDGNGGRRSLDRQGELFFYMHQQMLARYDAERVAHGVARVEPFAGYREGIADGFDPGAGMDGFGRREPGRRWRDLAAGELGPGSPAYRVGDHERLRTAIGNAVETGVWAGAATGRPVDTDVLGATLEPSLGAASDEYGNLHGMGHVLTALVEGTAGDPGVMIDPATAIRDPFFYRWHKHIDDFYRRWLDRQPPRDLAAERPEVLLRKGYTPASDRARSPDILAAFEDRLPAGAVDDPASLQAWADATFGGARWDVDDAAQLGTTDELETKMVSRDVLAADRASIQRVSHLVHRPIVWVLRLENLLPQRQQITVRIFLAPRELASDRWAWIELDRFIHELQPSQRAVIARPGKLSSVVRKPAAMEPGLLLGPAFVVDAAALTRLTGRGAPQRVTDALAPVVDRVFGDQRSFVLELRGLLAPADFSAWARAVLEESFLDSEKPVSPFLRDGSIDPRWSWDRNFCTCGWPYHLLLPRGTRNGMTFRIIVAVSDWTVDRAGPDSACGSLSFCGALDRYPDRQPMLYPFDRRFTRPIPDLVMQLPNLGHRDVTIRWTDPP